MELTELAATNRTAEHIAALPMTSLDKDGRTADALAVYCEIRKQLQEHTGTEPRPELPKSGKTHGTDRRCGSRTRLRRRTQERSRDPHHNCHLRPAHGRASGAVRPRRAGRLVGRLGAEDRMADDGVGLPAVGAADL
ncbi:DNA-binding SARP family transcriptional activator [Catenulispora sp. EB89]|uniref:BTAD domain-containing putative transcriptional regulator n=1 Tax=Catenulispora sp. EB89 TaxID=3156257 RepID=UPI003518BB6B